MANITKNFFYALSNNKFLNQQARKWGFRLGAEKFVAGTDLPSAAEKIKQLNARGISVTLDNLGEFVSQKAEATAAKEKILQMLDYIHTEKLDSHISVKLTQLGLEIDEQFCLENMQEIMAKANEYNIFVNIDMEKYIHYEPTLHILRELRKQYDNVGTVLQTYLRRTQDDLEELKDVRLRIVKGAYKESPEIAYQTQEEIDRNYIAVVKKRLLGEAFTSIATHDHRIINEIKQFVKENNISRDKFEFQMLYGFRTEMQYALAEEGYRFCTYIPFGDDWFGYFMRRLAERPQNMQLIVKDVLYNEDQTLKKGPVIAGIASIATIAYLLGRKSGKNKF